MSADTPVLNEAEARAVRRGVPDPGIALPGVAWPTVALWVGTFALWVGTMATALTDRVSLLVAVPLLAAVTFLMFTVLHEATHHAAGRSSRINETLGRLSIPFVVFFASFPMIRYIHIEHHRNTNEDIRTDPDAWTSHGSWWQLPFRWATIDAWYVRFYVPRMAGRPTAERREVVAGLLFGVALVVGAALTGNLVNFLLLVVLPQRIGLTVLAWWFDWLPHHGLAHTQRENRYLATRVRVGAEWAMTPVLLYQNYHLVHHLHPSIPFYRYVRAWKNNEEAYLAEGVPIATAWGRELSVSEYRAWRNVGDRWATTGAEEPGSRDHEFRTLTVAEVRPLTDDSGAICLDVPDEHRAAFAFVPGQHVVVRAEVDGREVRRTYSVCSAAGSDLLRIAVRRLDGGAFSTFATTELKAGDSLDVAPPAGRFTLAPAPEDSGHYAAVAAGSGITPVLAMLGSALLASDDVTATLVYANGTRAGTMFADEIAMLARQAEGRLKVVHVLSREDAPAAAATTGEATAVSHERFVGGRLTPGLLTDLVGDRLARADAWFVCGPQGVVDLVGEALAGGGVAADRLHHELFFVETDDAAAALAVESELALTIDGVETNVVTDRDETVLEAALRARLDPPYACAGGACGTCRALVTRGSVAMDTDHALTPEDREAGYVLTCQARPTTSRVGLDYDA
ncbi:2Fe-2S iron-sulfur cluster binding domain protein [Aeromicrobium marinum DSM 15272]|uniref:2Fe-2S iron-sulfur cluster binding domain protein n=1 Tax=Aeromicrobium marinum DSM 15272 TaxID=585531 RepID=E2SCG8_9ACTN|nr:fatty acid desaturase [Aeromicrobium marinum]EFQ82921.1 2Fe-2S iron-sulfur cluster binding domain protein [Aeromicrobium marinum DSM 15272]